MSIALSPYLMIIYSWHFEQSNSDSQYIIICRHN
nr:MAG TPA: hypothetical protein [Caudoviricetes sp.]